MYCVYYCTCIGVHFNPPQKLSDISPYGLRIKKFRDTRRNIVRSRAPDNLLTGASVAKLTFVLYVLETFFFFHKNSRRNAPGKRKTSLLSESLAAKFFVKK